MSRLADRIRTGGIYLSAVVRCPKRSGGHCATAGTAARCAKPKRSDGFSTTSGIYEVLRSETE